MPYQIVKQNGQYVVKTEGESGKVHGRHGSEEKAKAQMRALYANTPKSHLEENENWKKIKHFVYNHPIYSQLTEEEKSKAVSDIFQKHEKDDMDLLSEYVDMYMLPTGGWAQNTGNSVAYNAPYLGASGGGGTIPGYGGLGTGALGTKGRQGTRVYGYGGNNLSSSEGFAPMGNRNGDPAIVVVSPKVSNYKPWETEMASDGETRQKDIDRNKYKQDREDIWMGELGDVARALEDYGYDIEDITQMTQEEIEDIMVNILKKEKKEEQLQESINKIQEMDETLLGDLYEDEMIDEKWKRKSRIQDARHILATKHQKKEALEKEPHGRAYIIKREGIDKIMKKFGYDYDFQNKKWIKSSHPMDDKDEDDKPKTKPSAPKSIEKPEIIKKDSQPVDNDTKPEISSDKSDSVSKDKSDLSFQPSDKQKASNPLRDPTREEKIKEYQARFVSAFIFNNPTAVKYNKNEETGEMEPVVNKEEVYEDMNSHQYDWYNDKHIWLNQNLSLPDSFYEKGESKKSLIARSYDAETGNIPSIYLTDDNLPLMPPDQVYSNLIEKGYEFNDDSNKWEFVRLEETLMEAVDKSKKDPKRHFGYDAVKAEEMSARLALRSEQYKKLLELADDPNKSQELADYQKEISLNKNPVYFEGSGLTHPVMEYSEIEDELSKLGYKLQKYGYTSYWSNSHDVPKSVKKFTGDDLKSFLGRSVLASIDDKEGAKYLALKGDVKSGFKPIVNNRVVNDKLTHNGINFITDKGWIKQEFDPKDTTDYDAYTSDKATYYEKENQILNRYGQADWDALSYKDRRTFKEQLGNKMARQVLGISKNDWPATDSIKDEQKRSYYRNKMGIHYKFDPKQRIYVKREHPIPISGDYVDLKAAAGTLLRSVANSTTAAFSLGGILGKALKKLGKVATTIASAQA